MARKTDIRLRRSAVAGLVPSEGQLNLGELALNTADGALYFKKRDSSDNESIITAHDNNILHIDSTNARVGIGTLTPAEKLHVNGNIISSGKLTLLGDDPDFIQSMPANSTSNLIEHIFAVDGTTKATIAWSKVTDSNEFYIESAADIKLKTNGSTTAVTIGTDQKVTLADELVLGNNQGIYLSGSDDGNTTTSSKLFRATGNATRLEYYNNSFIFDAKDNKAWAIRNQNDTPIFKVTVAGELADFDGLGGAADTNIANSIVAVSNGDLSIVNGALNVGGTERITNAGNITGRDLTQARTDGQFEAWGDIRHRKDIEVLNSASDGWTTWLDRNNGTPNLQNLNNITMGGVLSGPSTFYIDPAPADTVDDATVDTGTVVIVGDLRVSGTTTTINSTEINIADVNLTLAQGSTQASDANGAGITVDVGTNDPVITDPTFTYTSAIDSWNMNKDLRIATGGDDATFMVGRDLTDEYIKIEVQDLNNVITASQDADADQPNPGDVSDHKFILNRTFAGTGESDFVVQNAGTDQLVIDKDGNVGIGTDSPATNLHVAGGSSGTNQALFRTSSGGGGGLQIVCSDLSLANPLWSINTFYGEALAFGDGTNEHMRIDSSGNLLVGTTNTTPFANSANSSADNGIALRSDGILGVAAYKSTANSGNVVIANRTGTDGSIIGLQKSGTTVGSIGTQNGDLFIGTGTTGLKYADANFAIIPFDPDDVENRDNQLSLGTSSVRFKDLHLSGNIAVGGTVDGRDLQTDGTKLDLIEAQADVTDATNVAAAGAAMLNSSPTFTGLNVDANTATFSAGTSGDMTLVLEADTDDSEEGDTPKIQFKMDAGNTVGYVGFVGTDGDLFTGSIANSLALGTDVNTRVQFYSNDILRQQISNIGDISFYEDTGTTAELFWDASAESLGIGTSSPAGKLEVNGGVGAVTTGGTLIVRQDGDTNTDGIAITSSHATSHRFWKDSGGKLNIGPSNSPSALVQDLAGNVGIGTDSPESQLNVVHQITADVYQYPLVVSGIDAGNTIDQTTSSGIGMQFKLANNHTDGQSMPGAAIVAVRENDDDDRNETSLVFQTTAHDANLAEHIRIKSDGKVGIGTNDPASKLHVTNGSVGNVSGDEITHAEISGGRHALRL